MHLQIVFNILLINSISRIMIAANSPPLVNFGPSSGTVLVQENFRINGSLFKITANDPDGQELFFSMVNDETKNLVDLSQKTYDSSTGFWEVDVLLKAQLDRDRSPNTRTLVFSVTDSQLPLQGRVSLTIRDVNDNPPMFTKLPYRISLPENSTIDEVVFIATAEDVDDGPGRQIVYSMTEQTNAYNKTFVLENENCGNITLKRQLDYETQPYYQFQIFVKDRGSPPCPSDTCLCSNITESEVNCAGEPAIFSVAVTDVQDTPPFFTGLPYLAYVYENATIGHSLFKVIALDGDRGVPNDVTYSLADNRYFIINSKTGEITLNSSLDADEPGGQNFILSVTAEEIDKPDQTQLGNTSATTQVAVTVYDVNDNGPEFTDANYTAYVQENTPQGVPLTIENIIYVTDKDQGSNSVFKLSVEKGGQLYADFETLPKTNVTGTTTVTIRVLNSSALDYEKVQTITFQIVAREVSTAESNRSYTNVTVYIEDMNDNTPVFANDTPRSINATEHSPNGTVLATISATDADSKNYSVITYSLEDTYDGKFNISSDTGQLMVAADIDREDKFASTFYSLVVVATDNMAGDDTNRRSSRRNVRVNVTDINDNFPEFQPYSPNVIVQENARVLTTIMTLTAVDKDAEHNGTVEYSIVQDSTAALNQILFDINSTTGVLFVNESLIGHSGFHNLTVMAHDLGNDQKNSTISVSVNVEDVNLNEPIFVVPDETIYNASKGIIPNITVDEGEPIRNIVIKLNATDGDIGRNGDVTYNIDPDLGEDYRFFDVGTFNGCLINTQSLDREKHEWYQINIKAEDSGSPNRLSKVIPFRIVLKDINDNEPYFPFDERGLEVNEEENNVPVGNVSVAEDKDSNPENRVICYYLYGGLKVNYFLLDKSNGTLIVLTKLDTEVTQSVEIYVKTSGDCSFAEDYFLSKDKNNSFNSSDYTLLKVTVVVLDINDNPPVFDKNALTTAVLFDIEVETPIFDLKTYTNDSDTLPSNRDNSFSLVGPITASADIPAGIVPGSFEVSPNGSVITKKLFSSNLVGYFILPVQVIDKNNQNDTANLKIYLVGNENRIRIVFNKQPNEVQERKAPFLEELSRALNMDIIADKITTHTNSDGASDTSRTDMYIHARSRPSGEIIESDELWKQIDFNADVRFIFQEYGVLESRPVGEKIQASTEVTVMEKSFIIVSICLGVICIVLVIVFINTTQRYRRKLRAATTSSYVREKHAPDVFVPPGTNQYKASNPLYGREVLPIDVDRLSQDSLDMNVVDEKLADDMPKNEDQEICMQIFDDDDEPRGVRSYQSHNLNSFIQEHEIGISGVFNASTSALTLSTRSAEPTDRKLRGHVKSDSGYTEHTMFDSLTDYEYTDI